MEIEKANISKEYKINPNRIENREYPKEYKRIQSNSDRIGKNRKESKKNQENPSEFGRIH